MLPNLTIELEDDNEGDAYRVRLRLSGTTHFDTKTKMVLREANLQAELLSFINEGDLDRAGQFLGEAIFATNELHPVLHQAFGDAQTLRVVIDVASLPLRGLPWELLVLPRLPTSPVGKTARYAFSRYLRLDPKETWPLRTIPARPHILVVVAKPIGTPNIPAKRFKDVIRSRLGQRATIEIIQGPETVEQLNVELQRKNAHVVFVIAHGAQATDGEFALCFEGAKGANHPRFVYAKELANTFRTTASPPHFIALISCFGATEHSTSKRSFAEALAASGAPAVLGMQGQISQNTAIRFVQMLCEKFAAGEVLDAAVSAARVAVHDHPDWWRPVLWTVRPELVLCPSPESGPSKLLQQHEPETTSTPVYHLLDERLFDLEKLRITCFEKWDEYERHGSDLLVFVFATQNRDVLVNIAAWLSEMVDRKDAINSDLSPKQLSYKTADKELESLAKRLALRRVYTIFSVLIVEDDYGLGRLLTLLNENGPEKSAGRYTLFIGVTPTINLDASPFAVEAKIHSFDQSEILHWLIKVQKQLHLTDNIRRRWEKLLRFQCEWPDVPGRFDVVKTYALLKETRRFFETHAGKGTHQAIAEQFISEKERYYA